ncbi:MAG: branched-chain amino acid ABC transporter substrate-binding protein [Burkholderiaceae bacterium]|nr:branched-chain amino acid ABC transporter substrate-binding protein [Burkholderiaceae bacterium]
MFKFASKVLKNKALSHVSAALSRVVACAGLALTVSAGLFSGNALAQAAPIKVAMIEGLSGPFGNTGEAVFRNLLWATERVNARGGLKLELKRYDSKGQSEEALSMLRSAIDDGAQVIMQGNSSATAAALIDAINKHNEREPAKRVIFLNYSAVDPILTNEKCSFWHFRFDAHADMRMTALMDVLKDDKAVKSIYIIGQDYSFGHAVAKEAKRQLSLLRPDMAVVGDELHPMGRVKDFLPYAAKIKASGAQAVLTGNFGNDLMLLVKAAKEVGFEGKFYTFYGNALGAPAAVGEAGIGKVVAVADWLPNVPTAASEAFYKSFKARFPNPADDYVHMRMQLMVEALAQSIEKAAASNKAGAIDLIAVANQLATAKVTFAGQTGAMRAADHQFQQPLIVGLMDKLGAPGVKFDVEGSGYGFRVIKQISAKAAEQPTSCKMTLPL